MAPPSTVIGNREKPAADHRKTMGHQVKSETIQFDCVPLYTKTPRTWKVHTPYARVRATLTPLCGVATPILMVPEASGGPGVYRSNPRPCALGFVSPGFESHAPPTCRA